MKKRTYTVGKAAVEQRTAAARQPRGGAREWKNVRVSSGVIAAIDARRTGGESRNEYLARMLRCKEPRGRSSSAPCC